MEFNRSTEFENELLKIAEYLKNKYPDSCLSNNIFGDLNIVCDDCLDIFNFYILNLCNCGNPEMTDIVIMKILKNIKERGKEYKEGCANAYQNYCTRLNDVFEVDLNKNGNLYGLYQFLLYVLDDKGMLEHGSGIGGAWLTELGIMYLHVLECKYAEVIKE